MRRTFLHALFLLTLLAVTALPTAAAPAAPPFDGVPEQAVLRIAPGPAVASGTGYLSPATRATKPFSHMLLRREAHVPAGAKIVLAVRASTDGATWTDWQTAGDNDDLWMPSDGPDVRWSDTIAVGALAQFWQVRGTLIAAPAGARPELVRIDVNTVDTRLSPQQDRAQRLAIAQSAQPRGSTDRPAVVSRAAWGSPDGAGSRAAPAYYPVNHMVVHHTADNNTLVGSEQSWADRVRAEWSFHTLTRGWGDVGYNYLIDPNGVVYEGRAGGDNAVAFHDTANYGSMGVVVLGTYSEVEPTQSSQQSLIRLLAWKAAQRQIDPLGASFYYGCSISKYCAPVTGTSVIANIAGHRQVTPGHTTCPGDAFMAIMPRIRHDVAALIAGTATGLVDNGDLQVDEFESGFSKSSANWPSATCGAGGNTYYTYATDTNSESTNSAIWRASIASAGMYHVYASIPQNCGLAAPPYASAQAKYRIQTADGPVARTVDQNTADAWVDLGAYRFAVGDAGAVTLDDITGEPYTQKKVLFFDAVKWVPVAADAPNIDVRVKFAGAANSNNRIEVPSGGLLKVIFTIHNRGDTVLYTQEPQASLASDNISYNAAGGATDDSYVYDQGECFLGDGSGSYPAFPKETNRIRVVLGPGDDGAIRCAGGSGGYPWRWGLNGALQPGSTHTIVGYVRFRTPGTLTLRAGVVQEYAGYLTQDVAPTQIVVTPEQIPPALPEFDPQLRPLAYVYTLGEIPSNFLARTTNPLSIPRGNPVGSFAWNGGFTDWGNGGPFGATGLVDQFIIEQTRAFSVPARGSYTFRTTSDDGSWLWIDGQQVVANPGLHDADEGITGTLELAAGTHVVAFKYFERTGDAAAGYEIRAPDADTYTPLTDATANGALALGTTYVQTPDLTVAADDLGGSGVARYRWSWDGANWTESTGDVLHIGKLQNDSYHLRYQAIDGNGNASPIRDLSFDVDTNRVLYRNYTPLIAR